MSAIEWADDADVLRRAATILRRRATKRSILINVLLNILRDTADTIDAAEEAKRPQ